MSSGEFTLFSFATPTLPAGGYKLTAMQQMMQQGGATIPGMNVDAHQSFLEVTAPRFALPADQILSTFPPNRAAGAFSTRLPQIVLRRRTLPWERRAAANQPAEVPWLALVLLADGEGVFTPNVPVASCVTTGVPMDGRNDVLLGDCLTVSNRIRAGAFPHLDEVGAARPRPPRRPHRHRARARRRRRLPGRRRRQPAAGARASPTPRT